MTAEDLYIIAIELGSSSVTGVAGKKLQDGSIHIEAIAQEPSSALIRNGMVFNMDKSVQCVGAIIKRLQEKLNRTITQVYVGFGGQSIHSRKNSEIKHFDGQVTISKEMVDDLMNKNLNANMGDRSILEVIVQESGVGTLKRMDPIGVLSDYIEGHFLNIVAHPSLRTNIDNIFSKVGYHVVEDKLMPLLIADEVLTDSEKRSGCVLVDFGADTTTVSVYMSNLLRFISVVPLGSANITKDIQSKLLEEQEAEMLKMKYGVIPQTEMTEERGNEVLFTNSDGATMSRSVLNKIIEARLEEILMNVKEQIKVSGFGKDSLVAGAIIVGGGANLINLSKYFTEITGFGKIRIVKSTRTTVSVAKGLPKISDSKMLSIVSLLAKGTQNCVSAPVPLPEPGGNIFDDEPVVVTDGPKPGDSNTPAVGPEVPPEEPKPENVEKPKKPHKGISSFFGKIKKFVNGIVEEE